MAAYLPTVSSNSSTEPKPLVNVGPVTTSRESVAGSRPHSMHASSRRSIWSRTSRGPRAGSVAGRDPGLGESGSEPHTGPPAGGDRNGNARALYAPRVRASLPDRVEASDVGGFRLAQQQVGQLVEVGEP